MPRTERTFEELLRYADLDLDEARRAVLLPAFEQVEASIAAVRAVDVGELPPATAFDARWDRSGA